MFYPILLSFLTGVLYISIGRPLKTDCNVYLGCSLTDLKPFGSEMESQTEGSAGSRNKKNPFLDLTFIDEVNKRENKDFSLYKHFQINPYNKKSCKFLTMLHPHTHTHACIVSVFTRTVIS